MELTVDEMICIVYGLRELDIQCDDKLINSLIERFRKEIRDEIRRNRNQ